MIEQAKHMDELIVKHLTGDISPGELEVLEAWKQQSADNATYFQSMEDAWKRSEALTAFRAVEVNADFERFKTRVGMQARVVKLPVRRAVMRFAAVLIPAITLIAAYSLYQTVPGFGKWEAFKTKDNIDSIVLKDASEVALNANSYLVYDKDFEGETRSLKLKGEAYFKVAKNPDKPFVVKVGATEVKVLGTEFNLDENEVLGVVTLSVTEGRVLFSSSDDKVEVAAGEKAVFANNEIVKSKLTSSNCIAWKTGTIVFEKASLDEVVETVLDHFTEVITVENKSSDSDLYITTRFNNPSLEDVLVELRIHFKKKFEINDNKLIISD
jgi:ferric-dicitrate binding protein FerR (iron transport regulator)